MSASENQDKPHFELARSERHVITWGDVKVEFNDAGCISVYGYDNVAVIVHEPANASVKKPLEPGDKMYDGTIFAGVSPTTRKNMFVTPQDLSGTFNWEAAKEATADLGAHKHYDWALPTRAELDVLFENREKIGGFQAERLGDSYWSSLEASDAKDNAWMKEFLNGDQDFIAKNSDGLLVRPVRTERVFQIRALIS